MICSFLFMIEMGEKILKFSQDRRENKRFRLSFSNSWIIFFFVSQQFFKCLDQHHYNLHWRPPSKAGSCAKKPMTSFIFQLYKMKFFEQIRFGGRAYYYYHLPLCRCNSLWLLAAFQILLLPVPPQWAKNGKKC